MIKVSLTLTTDFCRFGIVNAVMTKEEIKKDQEYFASYGYSVVNGPKWYRDLFREYALENPDKVKKTTLDELEEFELKLKQNHPENLHFNSEVGKLDNENTALDE